MIETAKQLLAYNLPENISFSSNEDQTKIINDNKKKLTLPKKRIGFTFDSSVAVAPEATKSLVKFYQGIDSNRAHSDKVTPAISDKNKKLYLPSKSTCLFSDSSLTMPSSLSVSSTQLGFNLVSKNGIIGNNIYYKNIEDVIDALNKAKMVQDASAEKIIRQQFNELKKQLPQFQRIFNELQITESHLLKWLATGSIPNNVIEVYIRHQQADNKSKYLEKKIANSIYLLLKYGEYVAHFRGEIEAETGENPLLLTMQAMQTKFWQKEQNIVVSNATNIFYNLKDNRFKLAMAEHSLDSLNVKLNYQVLNLSPNDEEIIKTQKMVERAKIAINNYSDLIANQEKAARSVLTSLYQRHAKRVTQKTHNNDPERLNAGRYAAANAVVEADVKHKIDATDIGNEIKSAKQIELLLINIRTTLHWVQETISINTYWTEDSITRADIIEALEKIRPQLQSIHEILRNEKVNEINDNTIVEIAKYYATAVFCLSDAYEAEADDLEQQCQVSATPQVGVRLALLCHNAAMLSLEIAEIELLAADARVSMEVGKKTFDEQDEQKLNLHDFVNYLEERAADKDTQLKAYQETLKKLNSLPISTLGATYPTQIYSIVGRNELQILYTTWRLHNSQKEYDAIISQRDEFAARLTAGAWPEYQKQKLKLQLSKTEKQKTKENLQIKIKILDKKRKVEIAQEQSNKETQNFLDSRMTDVIIGEEFLIPFNKANPLINLQSAGVGDIYIKAFDASKRNSIIWHQREINALLIYW
ncbi:MAG: hypothetical protein JW841_01545 [Deltaproteobacteria bacterium]|nr:hypothetical protein [Deltaproteobacteria bacterium]